MYIEKIYLHQDREDVVLTTYIPEDSHEMLNGRKRPAILICPGGGYFTCSDREAEPIALSFAAMGYAAFVLRYSVYTEGGTEFPDLSHHLVPKPHVQYPAAMREIGKAMLLLRERAEEWRINGNKIVLCGFSAGAHNVAMYATKWHTNLLSEHFKREKEEFRPAAVILGYMLSDYIYMNETVGERDSMNVAFFDGSNEALLGEARPSEERLKEVSPSRNVTENMPPAFLWATAEDTLVPVQHTIRMAHALADRGIPFEMHIFENGPHGLALSTQASAGARSQIYPDAAKWIDLVSAWLQKRFAIELPEFTEFEQALQKQIEK